MSKIQKLLEVAKSGIAFSGKTKKKLGEKMEVMEAVWRIIHIDGQLEKHEDHFAHKLSNLLRLTHKELIDAKIKARQQLS